MLNRDASPDPADLGINRVLAAAARHSLPVNLLASGRLEQARELDARTPDTQVVVDYLGLQQPFVPLAPAEPFADLPSVLTLATQPNVAIKIAGACTLSHQPFPYWDIWDHLVHIFDAFGLDRCLWGTDWTRALSLLTYEHGVEVFRVTDPLSGHLCRDPRRTFAASSLNGSRFVHRWQSHLIVASTRIVPRSNASPARHAPRVRPETGAGRGQHADHRFCRLHIRLPTGFWAEIEIPYAHSDRFG